MVIAISPSGGSFLRFSPRLLFTCVEAGGRVSILTIGYIAAYIL